MLRDFTLCGIWPIGRVEAVFPGRDGQTRVCSVKTAYGTSELPPSPFPAFSPRDGSFATTHFRRDFSRSALASPSLLPAAWGAGEFP